jgi:hypothetical protein
MLELPAPIKALTTENGPSGVTVPVEKPRVHTLNSEVSETHVFRPCQPAGLSLPDNAAFLHDVSAIRERGELVQVLVDQKDR